jgi:hypothetical protein
MLSTYYSKIFVYSSVGKLIPLLFRKVISVYSEHVVGHTNTLSEEYSQLTNITGRVHLVIAVLVKELILEICAVLGHYMA